MERNWRFAWLLKAVIPQAGQVFVMHTPLNPRTRSETHARLASPLKERNNHPEQNEDARQI